MTDLTAVLTLLRAGVLECVGDALLGLYLSGSLALGDFDPASSDVDFVAVTEGPLNGAVLARLGEMHATLRGRGGWGRELEGLYLTREAASGLTSGNQACPTLFWNGPFAFSTDSVDWVVQREIVRRSGVRLRGLDARELVRAVNPGDLAAMVCTNQALPTPLPDSLRQPVFGQALVVIRALRMLYTRKTGRLASKRCALEWGVGSLPAEQAELVNDASRWRYQRAREHPGRTNRFVAYASEVLTGQRRMDRGRVVLMPALRFDRLNGPPRPDRQPARSPQSND